jgi:hypothetical protein
MSDYDLVIGRGTVVTPADMFRSDIGIAEGRIQAIGLGLKGARTLDADGMLVMPGGVDTHCHIEQLREDGGTDEETFVTGSTSALAGGTTGVITFATQFKGRGIRRRREGAHRSVRIRAPDREQSGQVVWPVSSQGHDRAGRGHGPGDVGRDEAGHHRQHVVATRYRLHAIRGVGGDWLASRHHSPWRDRHAGRQGTG